MQKQQYLPPIIIVVTTWQGPTIHPWRSYELIQSRHFANSAGGNTTTFVLSETHSKSSEEILRIRCSNQCSWTKEFVKISSKERHSMERSRSCSTMYSATAFTLVMKIVSFLNLSQDQASQDQKSRANCTLYSKDQICAGTRAWPSGSKVAVHILTQLHIGF